MDEKGRTFTFMVFDIDHVAETEDRARRFSEANPESGIMVLDPDRNVLSVYINGKRYVPEEE